MKLNSEHKFHQGKYEMKEMKKQSNSQSTRLLVVACNLLLMLCTAQMAFAQQATPAQPQPNQQATSAVAASPAANAAAAASKPESEGIKIHGHWVLEVKNPDGKLVERREFNNALVTGGSQLSGDQVLAALLSGNAAPGGMAIAFISGPTTTTGLDVSSFCNGSGAPAGINCFGFYMTKSVTANNDATGQVIGNGQSGLTGVVFFSPSVNIVLSGNYTVPAALGTLGVINAVETYAGGCIPGAFSGSQYAGYGGGRFSGTSVAFRQDNIAPTGCDINTPIFSFPTQLTYGYAGAFTFTNIPGGSLPVTAGQIITVSVTISFS
jgi:hypothetical protein